MFYQSLILTLILSTAWAQLPPKVIKMKESLFKEFQSIPEVVSNHHQPNKVTLEESNTQIHQMFDEFIEQNQQGLDAILRVLQLVDHDLENVIQDCVRIFDIESLQSSNRIFVNVTKPLLDQVEHLCQIVTENRIDELEACLEQVESTAAWYREKLDETLQSISVILRNSEDYFFSTRIQLKKVEMMNHLNSLNYSLLEPMRQNITTYFTKWISDYRNFTLALPDDLSEEQEEISNLFDFLDFLERETSILQGELLEFAEYWFSMIEEVADAVNNGTEDAVYFIKEKFFEDLMDTELELKCAANYFQYFNPITLKMLNGCYQCIEFEEDIIQSFQQVASILYSTDKAINFLLKNYQSCVKLVPQFAEFTVQGCLIGMDEILEQTKEFIEHKTSEIYYHVEHALVFNGVMIEACAINQVYESLLSFGTLVQRYYNCHGIPTDGPVMLPML